MKVLVQPDFSALTKIKTIGSTYMAASGLNTTDEQNYKFQYIRQLINFAFAIKKQMKSINNTLGTSFNLRIGISSGPAVAGIIGISKPQFDIWGDTVNVASRMESSCEEDKVQVPEHTVIILNRLGFETKVRGTMQIKGKGIMKTFYVVDDQSRHSVIHQIPLSAHFIKTSYL